VTKEWFKLLTNLKDMEKEYWAQGGYTSHDMYATVQLNAEAIGKASVLRDLLEMDFETFQQGLVE